MDVAGLGVDIIEIDRMRTVLERTPSFRERVFTEGERAYCDAKARPEVHYALRFAAKEAVLKALGTGFNGVRVTDVEVANDQYGKPTVLLHGNALRLAQAQGVIEMHLSLSYTHSVGVANAVAVTEENLPHVDEKVDPRVELAAAFKEARGILDQMDGVAADDTEEDAGENADGTAADDTEEDADGTAADEDADVDDADAAVMGDAPDDAGRAVADARGGDAPDA